MSRLDHTSAEFQSLLAAACDEHATEQQLAQLEDMVRDEADVLLLSDYLQLDGQIYRAMHQQCHADKCLDLLGIGPAGATGVARPAPSPAAASLPVLGLLGGTIHNTVSYFSSGWPVAYLAATVILGIGLVIGAVTHVSRPAQIVRQSAPLLSPLSPLPSVVGQITGMVDCGFVADSKTKDLRPKIAVSLGDKFALRSGLMEITYHTGARVILQGPVTYAVESPAGGFLSVGKLTARVEDSKPKAQGPKTEDPNPKSPNLQISKFIVRTPTAVVTDLGTEFGVDVSRSGETTSHVFRGSIRVQRTDINGKVEPNGRILSENETVRVEGTLASRQIVVLRTFTPSHFTRQMPGQKIRFFDLVDAVAGGDGFSNRAEMGIDPVNGQAVSLPDRQERRAEGFPIGDRRYHRVAGVPFVDGVFVPDGSHGPVQTDSAGHRFEDCPATSNQSPGVICATSEKAAPAIPKQYTLGNVNYAASGHRAILLTSNKGITFDLDAMRKANPGWRLLRFRAMAGSTETFSAAGRSALTDLMVVVDGQPRFKRREINSFNGAFSVTVPIRDDERFLTLIATDGGDGVMCDWLLLGDPRIEMRSIVNGAKK
jgi:hypothetical protein